MGRARPYNKVKVFSWDGSRRRAEFHEALINGEIQGLAELVPPRQQAAGWKAATRNADIPVGEFQGREERRLENRRYTVSDSFGQEPA